MRVEQHKVKQNYHNVAQLVAQRSFFNVAQQLRRINKSNGCKDIDRTIRISGSRPAREQARRNSNMGVSQFFKDR
jgi:hypothetical protein